MNEFKIHVHYNSEGDTFQTIMNDLFCYFLKSQFEATCNIDDKELQYN